MDADERQWGKGMAGVVFGCSASATPSMRVRMNPFRAAGPFRESADYILQAFLCVDGRSRGGEVVGLNQCENGGGDLAAPGNAGFDGVCVVRRLCADQAKINHREVTGEGFAEDAVVEDVQGSAEQALCAGLRIAGVVDGANRQRLPPGDEEVERIAVVALKFEPDLRQPIHGLGDCSDAAPEDIQFPQTIVASDAQDQMGCGLGAVVELVSDAGGDAAIHGGEGCLPARGQHGAEVGDDGKPARDIAGVVKDGIAEKNDVVHG